MRRDLKPYEPILARLIEHAGSRETLRSMRLLELGPGAKVQCLRYLKEELGVERIEAAGRVKLWPWTRDRIYVLEHVKDQYLLDFLRSVPSASVDAVYSRHVMERHSIDPWVLLGSRRYWRQFKNDGFRNPGEDYPSSIRNVEAIFTEAYRALKPGGLIVSLIAKRSNTGLGRSFLDRFQPERIDEEPWGARSSLVSVKKGK